MSVHNNADGSITVVIPYFNDFEGLKRAAASLPASSSDADLTVVVVDNSTDPDATAGASGLADDLGWEHITIGDSAGFARPCNVGAKRATSEFVFFLNQDAVLEPDTLRSLTDCLREHPKVGAVSPSIVNQNNKIWFGGGRYSRRSGRVVLDDFGESWHGGDAVESKFLSGCALLVRRELFEAVGGFDERYFLYYEDVDLSDRMRAAGAKLMVVRSARVVHFRGAHGDLLRNLSPMMLTESLRSRRIYAATRESRQDRLIARATLPLEFARLAMRAIRARPSATRESLMALVRGLSAPSPNR